jgi:hypothetical protein
VIKHAYILAALFAALGLAQDAAITYPRLAEYARIQGEVKLRLGPDGVSVISGHPLLVPAAKASFQKLAQFDGQEVEAIYHFVLTEGGSPRTTVTTVKKGDAFDRVILRALRLKTEKTIVNYECVTGYKPENRIDSSKRPIEVWVYGVVCP